MASSAPNRDTPGSRPLDAEEAFLRACVEAFRDGNIEPDENEVLQRLQVALGIPGEKARDLARQAALEAREHPARNPGPLDPTRVVAACRRAAEADGRIDRDEARLVAQVAEVLGVLGVPGPGSDPGVGSDTKKSGAAASVDSGSRGTRGKAAIEEVSIDLPFLGPVPLVRLLAGLGALSIGAGVLFLVAANWNILPPWGRIGLIQVLMALVYGLAFEGLMKNERTPGVARALVLLGCMLFGGGIWQIGQTFHQGAHWPDGFLAWSLGIVPLAYALRSGSLMAMAMITLSAWNLFEQVRPHEALPWLPLPGNGSLRTLNLLFPPLLTAIGLPAILRFPAPRLAWLLGLGLASWSVIPLTTLGIESWISLGHAVVPGLVAAIAFSRIQRAEDRDPSLWQGRGEDLALWLLVGFGALLALTPFDQLLVRSLGWIASRGRDFCVLPLVLGVAGTAIAAWDWSRHRRIRARVVSRTLAQIGLAATLPPLLAAAGASPLALSVGYQLLTVAICFGAIHTGVVVADRQLLWGGLLPLGGWVGWTSLGWIQSLGSTGLSLIAGGVVILAGAYSLERLRSEVASWDDRNDDGMEAVR